MVMPNYHREHNIQNSIRLYCGEHDIPCFRCNVGKVKTETGMIFDTGLPEGFSDLFILYNGTIIFVEVKTKIGRQRQSQINFMNYVEQHGYKYIIPRSLEDFIEKIGGDNNAN